MRRIGISILGIILAVPFVVHAFPFGGRASVVLRCVYNSTIYTNIGPPRGGEYIWTTATKTYQFGPPAYAGQWLLGLAGAPYYCIYRISPLTIYTGIAMTMLGSSGPAAPPAPPTRGPTPPAPLGGSTAGSGAPSPTPTSPSPPTTSVGRVLISEVYYSVDVPHGNKPANEWIELYNGTLSAVNVAGWKIEDAQASDTIQGTYTIVPGGYFVIAATSATRDLWGLPSTVPFASLGNALGDGLLSSGDRIVLRNASGAIVDAVSWGSDTGIMQPSVLTVPYGNSMARTTLSKDTDTASDWAGRSPSPGN